MDALVEFFRPMMRWEYLLEILLILMKFRYVSIKKSLLHGREKNEMRNRISLNIAKNIAKSLWGIFFGVPAARARKENADADIRVVDAYDRMFEFLEKVGFSEEERKAINIDQIA